MAGAIIRNWELVDEMLDAMLFVLIGMEVQLIVWGGLRDGISVALALSHPLGPERGMIVTLTYCVVVFSILVQDLTIGAVTRNALGVHGAGETKGHT